MIEQMRRNAIDSTFKKWESAVRNYYKQGYDNGEATTLYKELEKLGANMDPVFDRDLEIRDEVKRTERWTR